MKKLIVLETHFNILNLLANIFSGILLFLESIVFILSFGTLIPTFYTRFLNYKLRNIKKFRPYK